MLLIKWDAVQNHVDMTKSPDFQLWRGAVGACFAGKPRVFHTETVVG
jgi:hypothetical protein